VEVTPPKAGATATAPIPAWEQKYRERCERYSGNPSNWPAQPPSDADGLDLMAQFSACSWVVSQDPGGVISANLYIPRRRDLELPFEPSVSPKWQMARCSSDDSETNEPKLAVSDFLQIQNGFLVGYNSGEFGGGLSWFDGDGRFRQSITTENTQRIIPTRQGAVVFTGLAHGLQDTGHVLRLLYGEGRWRMTRANLPGAPLAVLSDADESFVVVTTRHLVRIRRDFRVVLLHRGAWRGNPSPNSIVRDSSGRIYLGMSYAVARLRPTQSGYVEEWLAPSGPQLPHSGRAR
jgi:hypothetical protein